MPQPNEPASSGDTHVVLQNLNDEADFIVVAAGQPVAMIYSQVFGPASQAACEAWVAAKA